MKTLTFRHMRLTTVKQTVTQQPQTILLSVSHFQKHVDLYKLFSLIVRINVLFSKTRAIIVYGDILGPLISGYFLRHVDSCLGKK